MKRLDFYIEFFFFASDWLAKNVVPRVNDFTCLFAKKVLFFDEGIIYSDIDVCKQRLTRWNVYDELIFVTGLLSICRL